MATAQSPATSTADPIVIELSHAQPASSLSSGDQKQSTLLTQAMPTAANVSLVSVTSPIDVKSASDVEIEQLWTKFGLQVKHPLETWIINENPKGLFRAQLSVDSKTVTGEAATKREALREVKRQYLQRFDGGRASADANLLKQLAVDMCFVDLLKPNDFEMTFSKTSASSSGPPRFQVKLSLKRPVIALFESAVHSTELDSRADVAAQYRDVLNQKQDEKKNINLQPFILAPRVLEDSKAAAMDDSLESRVRTTFEQFTRHRVKDQMTVVAYRVAAVRSKLSSDPHSLLWTAHLIDRSGNGKLYQTGPSLESTKSKAEAAVFRLYLAEYSVPIPTSFLTPLAALHSLSQSHGILYADLSEANPLRCTMSVALATLPLELNSGDHKSSIQPLKQQPAQQSQQQSWPPLFVSSRPNVGHAADVRQKVALDLLERLAPFHAPTMQLLKEVTGQTAFILGCKFAVEEGRQIEFKEGGSFKDAKYVLTMDKMVGVISSFLNGDGGSVYAGIDDDGIVRGVKMNTNQRDQLQRHVHATYGRSFHPPICGHRENHMKYSYDLLFHRVYAASAPLFLPTPPRPAITTSVVPADVVQYVTALELQNADLRAQLEQKEKHANDERWVVEVRVQKSTVGLVKAVLNDVPSVRVGPATAQNPRRQFSHEELSGVCDRLQDENEQLRRREAELLLLIPAHLRPPTTAPTKSTTTAAASK